MPLSWADVDPAVILGAAEELRAKSRIVCKRLDTALGKDAAAEAQPIRDSCTARNFPTAHLRLLMAIARSRFELATVRPDSLRRTGH